MDPSLRTRYGTFNLYYILAFSFSHSISNSNEGNVLGYYEDKIEEGKVIKVQDVAFVTYAHSSPVPPTTN